MIVERVFALAPDLKPGDHRGTGFQRLDGAVAVIADAQEMAIVKEVEIRCVVIDGRRPALLGPGDSGRLDQGVSAERSGRTPAKAELKLHFLVVGDGVDVLRFHILSYHTSNQMLGCDESCRGDGIG